MDEVSVWDSIGSWDAVLQDGFSTIIHTAFPQPVTIQNAAPVYQSPPAQAPRPGVAPALNLAALGSSPLVLVALVFVAWRLMR